MKFLCGGRDLEVWQHSTYEETIEPELEIIDPHHHLWNPFVEQRGAVSKVAKITKHLPAGLSEFVFAKAFPKAALDTFTVYNYFGKIYEIEDYKRDFQDQNVKKSICVESGWKERDVEEEMNNVAATVRNLERNNNQGGEKKIELFVVGFVDLRLGREKVLSGISEHLARNNKVVGFRHQCAYINDKTVFNSYDSSENIFSDENFKDGLSVFATTFPYKDDDGNDLKRKMTFETWCHFTQLKAFAKLVNDFPDVEFILDHIGSPIGIGSFKDKAATNSSAKYNITLSPGVIEAWKEGLTEVSRLPNVTIKLSGFLVSSTGLGEFYKRSFAPSSDEICEIIYDFVNIVIELFGVDRCMFASNFPVDKTNVSFNVLYNGYKKVCNKLGFTEDIKRQLFYSNAERIYRLH